MKDQFPSVLDVEINRELNQIWNYTVWLGQFWDMSDEILYLSFKKDVIIHLWSIIEWLLFYILEVLCSKWSITLDTTEHKYTVIHTISTIESIMIARKSPKKIPTKILDFCKLIDILHEKHIIDIDLKKRLHTVREYRNWVHVSKKILGNDAFRKIVLSNYVREYNDIIGELKAIYVSVW